MKKTISLALAALLAVSLLAVPAAAETTTFTWDLPHNTPIKHKGLMVMEHTVGVEIGGQLRCTRIHDQPGYSGCHPGRDGRPGAADYRRGDKG